MKITKKNLEKIIIQELSKLIKEAQLVPAPVPAWLAALELAAGLGFVSVAALAGYGVGTGIDKLTGASDAIASALDTTSPVSNPDDVISREDALKQMEYSKQKSSAVTLIQGIEAYYKNKNQDARQVHPKLPPPGPAIAIPTSQQIENEKYDGDLVQIILGLGKIYKDIVPGRNGKVIKAKIIK